MNRKGNGAGLVASLAVALSAGLVGLLLSGRTRQPKYYKELRKPSWSPPPQVFGPVWTVLYAMMGTAAWLIWRRREQAGARAALGLYGVQLVLNSVWTGIFFGLRRPRAAYYELLTLWATLLATTVAALRVSREAGLLLVPYLGWTTFAALLNKKIVDLNPEEAGEQPLRDVAVEMSRALSGDGSIES